MAETFIPIPVETVLEAEEQPSLTYRLDLENGRIVGKVDGLTAVNQAIRKAIITPRFKCLIYDPQYGSEIEDAIIAKDATRDYIEAATEGFVKDALLRTRAFCLSTTLRLSWRRTGRVFLLRRTPFLEKQRLRR